MAKKSKRPPIEFAIAAGATIGPPIRLPPLPEATTPGRLEAAPRKAKYGNEITHVGGIKFQSKREANRYIQLTVMLRCGRIQLLELQPEYSFDFGGVHICKYFADFRYTDLTTGLQVVEDAKGVRTKEYKIKRALMLAFYGIKVQEV